MRPWKSTREGMAPEPAERRGGPNARSRLPGIVTIFSQPMNKFLLSCLAGWLVAGAAQAQTAATPSRVAPPKRTPTPANQILEYGGFELPRVQARMPKLK